MVIDLIAMAMLSLLVVVWLKERVLYVIFPWAYVQNFVLAWAYTSGWAGKDLCHALLLSKEFLLFGLFLYFLQRLPRNSDGGWPLPIRILGAFTVWCVARYAVAGVFQGQSVFGNLWNLRIACFPFEILTVAMGVASASPQFAKRFIRNMVFFVVALAVVGIGLDVLPSAGFWRDHANIARYNFDIKGESSAEMGIEDVQGVQALSEGITGNGIARVAFSSLSPFRAFGTVGDAVGFGHFVAFPLLLLAFCLRRNWKTQTMLVITATALFLSFTRSAWIFVAVAFLYVLLRERRYKLVFGLTGSGAIALFFWAPLAGWYSTSLGRLSSNSTDPHAQGLFWFYTQGLWQLKNLFGQGMSTDIPESGYGILLIRYGLPAVATFVWFCFALYRSLRQTRLQQKPVFLVAQAVPLALLVILNFSYYPFSFIPYLLVWFVVGTCLAVSSTIELEEARGNRLTTNVI